MNIKSILISSFLTPEIDTAIIIIAALVVVFLIFREFVCWYWKINEMVKSQQNQIDILKKIYVQLGGDPSDISEGEDKKD